MNLLRGWRRLEYDEFPVYIQPERPDWFVPGRRADELLRLLCGREDLGRAVSEYAKSSRTPVAEAFFNLNLLRAQISSPPPPPYGGRAGHLSLTGLKECWFHLTNKCNLACRHCLFAASPAESEVLPRDVLNRHLAAARASGCRLFYFTGGEPFVYPEFVNILKELLADSDIHAVVLTNGLLLAEHAGALKNLPLERLHLQISMDGLEHTHDLVRGKGAFQRLLLNLAAAREAGLAVTLSMAVNRLNVAEMPDIIRFGAEHKIKTVHFLWHFVRGKGKEAQFVKPSEILPHLLKSCKIADDVGVLIDNLETIKSQVFSTPGTRHDLSNTGWESLAVAPDGIYPSPALVGVPELYCGSLGRDLIDTWRNSPVLRDIRGASLIDSEKNRADPFKFLIGGGDLDHSFLAGGGYTGHDPYMEIYNTLALMVITRQAAGYPMRTGQELVLKMGDVRHDCPEGGEVVLTHCNCVISLADDHAHQSVRDFYARAAVLPNEEICNPFAATHSPLIPEAAQKRSYGCGSPVQDAAPRPGEILVDLGSGSGVECFTAAAEVGSGGRVYGIDMTDEMLALARSSQKQVSARLGYDNIRFIKGYLEDIPLPQETADVVISNCVINLSPDKRRTFHEILRILKPGGRLLVSDIVTDWPVPVEIKNDERFRGECLGGALRQVDLAAMLRAAGFCGVRFVKRFPYRREGTTDFYSLTYSAYKPGTAKEIEVVYRGPFGAVYTEAGTLLLKGKRTTINIAESNGLDDSVFIISPDGTVLNQTAGNGCCAQSPSPAPLSPPAFKVLPVAGACCSPAAGQDKNPPEKIVSLKPAAKESGRHRSGCMVCGEELVYLPHERKASCFYCGANKTINALCVQGHFICDDCHQQDGLSVIKIICLETRETDMISLLKKIRSHPALPMHGPEHHAMVPGIILATYRNRGGRIGREAVLSGIERGSKVPGGVCGFWGNCGAATGVGIGFSVLLDATPLTPEARGLVQGITAQVLAEIALIKGGRCCQRETVTALRAAARLAEGILPHGLAAAEPISCAQFSDNKECIRGQCPLWQERMDAGRPNA